MVRAGTGRVGLSWASRMPGPLNVLGAVWGWVKEKARHERIVFYGNRTTKTPRNWIYLCKLMLEISNRGFFSNIQWNTFLKSAKLVLKESGRPNRRFVATLLSFWLLLGPGLITPGQAEKTRPLGSGWAKQKPGRARGLDQSGRAAVQPIPTLTFTKRDMY